MVRHCLRYRKFKIKIKIKEIVDRVCPERQKKILSCKKKDYLAHLKNLSDKWRE